MSLHYRIYNLIIFLFFTSAVIGFGEKTFFCPRFVSSDPTHTRMSDQALLFRKDHTANHMHLSCATSYHQSFKGHALADYFFGSSQLVFSGSQYPDRGKNDILADYFGLSTTAKSTVCFKPEIAHFVNDFYWHCGLDGVIPGLYISFHVPFTHTLWDLNMEEKVVTQGQRVPAGYFGPTRTEVAGSLTTPFNKTLAANVKEFFSGVRQTVQGQITNLVIGDIQEPLHYGKIAKRQVKSGISEITTKIGYTFVNTNQWSLAGSVQVGANTSNHSHAEYLFEPLYGNGGHWQLGADLQTTVQAWNSKHGTHGLSLYASGECVHLFKSQQRRSFDFKQQGKGSRYMLLQQMGNPSEDLFLESPVGSPSSTQYQGRLIPAINVTTLSLKTSIPLQATFSFSGLYEFKNSSWELGYTLFARMKEQAFCREKFLSGIYSIKGDAQVYGFDADDTPYRLAATQHAATIHAGQAEGNFSSSSTSFSNMNIDSPVLAASSTTILNSLTAADDITPQTINTSAQPLLLSDADINVSSGLLPSAVSHRMFVNCLQVWNYETVVTPFVGLGGYIEWAPRMGNGKASLLNQWGIMFKGGVTF